MLNNHSTIYCTLINILIICVFLKQAVSQCTESCLICSNNTTCTSCVTQTNLILVNGSIGCLPCSYKCEKCIAENQTKQCVSCANGFYQDPISNGNVCKKCKLANCKKCNQYFPAECLECQVQYFLEESTMKCKSCKNQYAKAKTCRENYIYTCQEGYFTSNGQDCSLCSGNLTCKVCSSSSICSQCYDGYFLLNSKCLSCDPSCRTCNSNTTCTTCPRGFRLNSFSRCQNCSTQNCLSCTINDICQQCKDGYYFDNQFKKCILLDLTKQVQNCARYSNNFNFTITSIFAQSSILCKTCNSGSYLSTQTNSCQYCSILCQSCSNLFRSSKCLSCKTLYSRLIDSTNGICAPKIYTQQNQKIIYINNRNDIDKYQTKGFKMNFTQNMKKCPGGSLGQQISVKIPESAGYSYKFNLRVLLSTSGLAPYNISIFFNQFLILNKLITNVQSSNNSSVNMTQILVCNELKVFNLSFSLDIVQFDQAMVPNLIKNNSQNNVIKMNSSSANGEMLLLDIKQMVILVKQCHSTCSLCYQYKKCIKCENSSYYIEGQKCVQKCQNGYFLNPIKKECLTECPVGMYSNIKTVDWICELCKVECKACSDWGRCLSCSQGYYLYENLCLKECPKGYFRNEIFRKCQVCTSPCQQCISLKECSTCMSGFHFSVNSTCLSYCPQQYYGNLSLMSCKACQTPCYTCKTRSICLSCTAGSGLSYYNGNCLSSCPRNLFSKINQQMQKSCSVCNFPCLQCIQQQNKCTACIQGFLLNSNNSCIQNCPQGYFNSIQFMKCLPCSFPCKSCLKDENTCLSCQQGYFYNRDNNNCLPQCQKGYYRDIKFIGQCKKCKSQCQECNSLQNCSICTQGYYLQGSICLIQCSEGYFKLMNNNSQPVCEKCHFTCKSCFGQADYCISCIQNYFLQQDNTCDSTCLTNQLYPGCQDCEYPCYSCNDSKNKCTSCQIGYYLFNETNQCVSECYLGYYKGLVNRLWICLQCPWPCVNCVNQNYCLSCSNMNNNTLLNFSNTNGTKYYLRTISSTVKTCVTNCSLYEYKNQLLAECLQCMSPCLTCLNSTYCTSCENGVLINGICLSKLDGCPVGNYQINSTKIIENVSFVITTCTKCPTKCSSCKSSTVCTACVVDYYLFQNKCIDFCPSGTTPLRQLRKCIYCEYPCVECQNYSSFCTKCGQISLLNVTSSSIVCPQNRKMGNFCIKYYLYEGQCMQKCSATTYPSKDKCLPCKYPCLTCSSQLKCTSCSNGTYMLQNVCYATCPTEYYKNDLNGQCTKCLYPCKICSNQSYCLQCRQGYLFNNQCLIKQTCPIGFLEVQNQTFGKICQKCDEKCLVCSQSLTFCLECNDLTLSVYEGSCLKECPDSYYSKLLNSSYLPNKTISSCIKCPDQCLTCKSQSICTNCDYSYYLLNQKCVIKCPPGFMVQQINYYSPNSLTNYTLTQKCIPCKQPCSECSIEQNICESCILGYYMYEKKCLQTCYNGTYLNNLTKQCKQCPFPCKNCYQDSKGDIMCLQCFTGYFVSQNLICVQKCLDDQFIDFNYKKCVSSCSGGYQVQDILTFRKYCAKQCYLPYLKDNKNSKCVTSCPQGQYINSDYQCVDKDQNYNRLSKFIPQIEDHIYISNNGILTLYIEFSSEISYQNSFQLTNLINITYNYYSDKMNSRFVKIIEDYKVSGLVLDKNKVRLLTSSSAPSSQQQNYLITSVIPYIIKHSSSKTIIIQLYPQVSISAVSYIKYEFLQNSNLNIIQKTSRLPLQVGAYSISLDKEKDLYQKYDYGELSTMKFKNIGQIVINFVLIIGLLLVVFNRYSKVYNLLILLQSIFLLSSLNIILPLNLYQFLYGFKYAFFYQFPNFIMGQTEHYEKFMNFQSDNFNRIQSIFGDGNFVSIAGHLISIYIVILAVYVVMNLIKYLSKLRTYNEYLTLIFQIISRKVNYFKWSYLTDIYVSTFMLIIAAFWFQTISYESNKIQQSIGIILSYIFFILFLSYTIYFGYKNYKILNMYRNEPQKFVTKQYLYKQNYISFFEGISAPENLYKNYLIVGKIMVYGFGVGLLWDYPNLVLSVFIVLELVYAGIFVFKKPYSDEYQNYLYAVSNVFLAFGMVLMTALSQYNINSLKNSRYSFNASINQTQQAQIMQKKSMIGYFVIISILISVFILIIQMFVSIMRGNLKRKRLDGQEEDHGEMKFNMNPKDKEANHKNIDANEGQFLKANNDSSILNKNLQYKKSFQGYQVQQFNNKSQSNSINEKHIKITKLKEKNKKLQ